MVVRETSKSWVRLSSLWILRDPVAPPKFENPPSFTIADPLSGGVLKSPALAGETGNSVPFVAPDPFPKRWSGYPALERRNAVVSDLPILFNPSKTPPAFRIHPASLAGTNVYGPHRSE